MNDEERLILMKQRILRSFKWHGDVVCPLADYFGITFEEMEDIFMDNLDMSSLEALHSSFDTAKYLAIKKRIYIDLELYLFEELLELITPHEAEIIQTKLARDVYIHGREYDESIEEGKSKILELLKGE